MITKIEILRSDSNRGRWHSTVVKLTDKNGKTWEGQWDDTHLKVEQLKLKLLLAGANEDDLEEFGDLRSSEGAQNEADNNAGEAM